MTLPLFQRVLGADFTTLSPAVMALHTAAGLRTFRGEVEVLRGTHPVSRLFAWATHLPTAGQGEALVEIASFASHENWVRHLGGRAMPSRLWQRGEFLCEQLGLARFEFSLAAEHGDIVWRVSRISVLGLPLPAYWFKGVVARESQRGDRYHFDVQARMPLVGLLVHYRGMLYVI